MAHQITDLNMLNKTVFLFKCKQICFDICGDVLHLVIQSILMCYLTTANINCPKNILIMELHLLIKKVAIEALFKNFKEPYNKD